MQIKTPIIVYISHVFYSDVQFSKKKKQQKVKKKEKESKKHAFYSKLLLHVY